MANVSAETISSQIKMSFQDLRIYISQNIIKSYLKVFWYLLFNFFTSVKKTLSPLTTFTWFLLFLVKAFWRSNHQSWTFFSKTFLDDFVYFAVDLLWLPLKNLPPRFHRSKQTNFLLQFDVHRLNSKIGSYLWPSNVSLVFPSCRTAISWAFHSSNLITRIRPYF